eukprot:GCRY01003213.1.p1 GENE.GCRY01003213.1~~GCRY01003213.1.p1  ORF type:complete len:277 (+),score=49.69 GCRY01003213.1:155-985(+)
MKSLKADNCPAIDGPVLVLPDIHGNFDLLMAALKFAEENDALFSQRTWVFLGDIIDRGPQVREALDFVLKKKKEMKEKCIVLMGNHELAFVGATQLVPTPAENNWKMRYEQFYQYKSTLSAFRSKSIDEIQSHMTEEEKSFFASLPWVAVHPQYIFVHAGFRPNVECEKQLEELAARDFTLNRPPQLTDRFVFASEPPSGLGGRKIVAGHQHVSNVISTKTHIFCDRCGGKRVNYSLLLLPEEKVVTARGERTKNAGVDWEMPSANTETKEIQFCF